MDRNEAMALMKELSSEHTAVLGKLKTLETLLKEGRRKRVREALLEIREDLETHFKKEEEMLFPFLNKYFEREMERMGGPIRPVGGPIQVMLAEHKLIMQAMDELQQAGEEGLDEKVERYILLQRSHIFREDVVLFKAATVLLKG